MGYGIRQLSTSVIIKAALIPAALTALKQLGRDAVNGVWGPHYASSLLHVAEANTFDRALDGLGWSCDYSYDGSGDCVRLHYLCEKSDYERRVLKALAPFVQGGCVIRFSGEDLAQWEFVFRGEKLYEARARMVWGEGVEVVL